MKPRRNIGNLSAVADAAIETHALSKRYGRARGIEDLSFRVPRGEVFGFLGPNGAGKTTTIRVLLGLLRPTGGGAQILGHDVTRDGVAARRRTGFLPGDFSFDERVTGAELIDLLADVRGIEDRCYARELADRFDAALHRPLGDLSRGNRQKLGLVQALLHRPEVVIMDEPTAGLDPLMQEEFEGVVDELRAAGTTVFLSSHNLPEVERLCDRIGILRDGRLVAVEAVAALAERAVRHIVLRFDEPVDPAAFGRLAGVTAVRQHGSALELSVSGEVTEVIRAAAAHRVLDVEATRPPLEEIFATYYGEPEEASRP